MNKLLLIIVTLLTVGCSEWWEIEKLEYPLHYHLDKNSPAEMQVAVYAAAEEWNELAVRKGLQPVFIYEGEVDSKVKSDNRFDVISLDTSEFESDVGEGPAYLGKCRKWADGHDARVDILFAPHKNIKRWAGSNDSLIDAYYVVALHELGHSLGLGHVLEETELMYYYARELDAFPSSITPHAEGEFCRLHGCE